MGDERRGAIFACWIVKNFSKAQSILDIAGGKGQVARKLANKKKEVHVIDAKPRFAGRSHRLISYQAGWFTEDTKAKGAFDLVIGVHPDEATSEIIRYAVKHRMPFAVVPCCIKGRDSDNISGFQGWLNRLSSIAKKANYNVTIGLPKMQGKNTVIRGIPPKKRG